jgi:hypothetical protein
VFSNKLWYKDTHLTEATALAIVGTFIDPWIDSQHPGFDQTTYLPRVQFAKDISNRKVPGMGAVISSADAASEHIMNLSGLADAMQSALTGVDLKPLNDIAAKVGVATGNTPLNTYQAIKTAVASEVAKTVAGGLKPDEDTIKEYGNALDIGLKNGQIQDVLKYYVGLMHPRVSTLDNQSMDTMKHHLTNVGSPTTQAFKLYGFSTPWEEEGGGNNNQSNNQNQAPKLPVAPKGNAMASPEILQQFVKAFPGDIARQAKEMTARGWQ